jgi:DNA replication and repair protein RecF
MILKKIQLTNFRNIISETVEFDNGINVITGPNAQGKTNLIEAVAYWSAARNFRTVHEDEMIRFGEKESIINAEIFSNGRDQRLDVKISRGGKKQLLQNGAVLQTARELMGVLPAVLFTPGDLNIVSEGPNHRRRLMDMTLCQLYPTYITALSAYNKIQRQKQKMLSKRNTNRIDIDLLSVYNVQLAKYGASIITKRARFMEEFKQIASQFHGHLSRGKENLTLRYKTVSAVTDPNSEEPIINSQLSKHFAIRLPQEIACGFCITGPHRDNILLYADEIELKVYGSQGQSRTAAIALKMAEREYLKNKLSEPPLLLLDDVLSELDESRRRMILSRLNEGQIFITGCENRRTKLTQGRVIRVKNGTFT